MCYTLYIMGVYMPYKNKEGKQAYDKAYYEKNKDRIKEYQREYNRTYYEKNKEKKAIYDKEYCEKNRKTINDRHNQYRIAKNNVSRKTAFKHRKEWTPEEDTILIKLKKQGKTQKEIAKTLGRTIGSINIRLVTLRKADPFNGFPHDDI